ncbi:cryptochrome/photolyase family protein [Gluconobacter oxydans]|uniref:cryptochrome/photolyase family protein n=1 Tax=Gluconobacter oxydans TaxID=442 RepID=UPI000780324C|nr:deoxyribodipyrimidine photo-lyase [Gluconobacter oxydans]KXV12828.1 deoxyribodipyrimidine photolyase [Gluconobacter oxydans]MCP1248666.1 DNA photolyase family protein [Gluconobacter oxydans]WKE47250.1 DNA photolyase family protein [Gluconobacter oxydans]
MSSSQNRPAIVWFRDDLRMADHPALHEAAASGRPLICLYILDDVTPALHPLGAAARWWLHGALADLRRNLEKQGGTLLTLSGSAEKLLPQLAKQTDAASVHWHHRLHERERAQDNRIRRTLEEQECEVHAQWGTVLVDPDTVQTKQGGFYKVCGSFWKALQTHAVPEPLEAPSRLSFHAIPASVLSDARLNEDSLCPQAPDWAAGFRKTWEPGEAEGQEHLEDFLKNSVAGYPRGRDRVAEEGTSRLSPYLASGAVSPRQVWAALQKHGAHTDGPRIFLSELGWREFARYTLYHLPKLPFENLSPKFSGMHWRRSAADLKAWQRGQTGVPIVDAGMRQLWQTGWMHNRARMIVGSFLTKHLLIDWKEGDAWFRDTLVDADFANNAMNWQWVAGTGIEATPFFRIFNPTRQAEKFDPNGDYIRQWVPELRRLSGKALFEPWAAKDEELEKAGVRLGKSYPRPIVDLKEGRDRALQAFRSL